jgi:hypothetical protein
MVDRRPVLFVGDPVLAPADTAVVYARPDDISDDGRTWRARLVEYNQRGNNRLGFFPAWQLYEPGAYRLLVKRFGLDSVFILSAGWGLLPARFLTPAYDITFKPPKKYPWKRRRPKDLYEDFSLMPDDGGTILFLGGTEYQALFIRVSSPLRAAKVVYFRSATPPELPDGFTPKRYETAALTNWHYLCARDLAAGKLDDAVPSCP